MANEGPSNVRKLWVLAIASVLLVLGGIGLGINQQARRLVFPEYAAAAGLVAIQWFWIWGERRVAVRDAERSRDIASLMQFCQLFIAFGFYLLVRVGWTHGQDNYRLLFVTLLWGLAFLTAGGLVGFLFGIPRTLAGTSAERAAEAQRVSFGATRYQVNTNLERVSDWLTTIIVGGTVAQLALLPEYWSRLGTYFARAVAQEAGGIWAVSGASSALFFLVAGFLCSYLITRLFLSGAIQRADGSAEGQVAKLSNLTKEELEALEATPLHYGEALKFETQAEQAAERILSLPLDELSSFRDLRVWAKAQLAKGNMQEAIRGYVRALQLVPDDAEARLGHAVALGGLGTEMTIILRQLEQARDALMEGSPTDLRKNVFKSLTFAQLHLKQPESFRRVLESARTYFRHSDPIPSAGLLFNIACAYGQAHAWLSESAERRLDDPELEYEPWNGSKGQNDHAASLQKTEQRAVELLTKAIARSPGYKDKLREMITDPDTKDTDFKSLVNSAELKKLAGVL